MKTITVGGREVSSLILGTDYFGATVPRETAFELMDEYFARGGRAIDTARMYAQWIPGCSGVSEKTIGAWMSERRNRNDVYLITKGGARDKGSEGYGRLSRSELSSDLGQSLEALGVDSVDMYFLHRDDPERNVGDIMETLERFIRAGKVKAVGASNWSARRIAEANSYALNHEMTPFSVSEIQWSLARSTPELHKDPSIVCMTDRDESWYAESKLPVFAFSSQAKGFFARGIEHSNQKALDRFGTPDNIARLERVRKLAEELGVTPSAVALAYITSSAHPAAALIGCKTLEQLRDSMTAADLALTSAQRAYLSDGI